MPKCELRLGLTTAFAVIAVAVSLGSIARAQDVADATDPHGVNFEIAAPAYEGFYLRADISAGQWSLGSFAQEDLANNGGSFVDSSIDRNLVIAGGIGWQMGNGLRFDLTGEHRARASFEAVDNLTARLAFPDGVLQANTTYSGELSSTVGLLNGYWDIARFDRVTPYLGAGIGFAHTTISGVTTSTRATFTDANTGARTVLDVNGASESNSETKFAWALMAGASVDLSSGTKLDFGYRYLNLSAGSSSAATTGLLVCECGSIGSPLTLDNLDAHEFRIGLRWQLGEGSERYRHRSLK